MRKNNVVMNIILTMFMAAMLGTCVYEYKRLPQDTTVVPNDYFSYYNQEIITKSNIGVYTVKNHTFTASGFFFLPDESTSVEHTMKAYLRSTNSNLYYELDITYNQYRPDVTNYFSSLYENPLNYDYSGFTVTGEFEELLNGKYCLYIYYESANYKIMDKCSPFIKVKAVDGVLDITYPSPETEEDSEDEEDETAAVSEY